MYHPEVIYHVYNQSINYETLFRDPGNYRLFLSKVKKHLLPCADIFAFCLMPDHFHLMLKPTPHGCRPSPSGRYLRGNEPMKAAAYQQNLSHALKTVLSSYTQAVNKAWGRRGSLFRAKTKAKPGYADFYPDAYELEETEPFTRFVPYLKTCFFYIHDNPVKANYTDYPEEWEFSSALDYAGYRDSEICNYEMAERLLGVVRSRPAITPRPTDLPRTG